jgi:hypothetical protein
MNSRTTIKGRIRQFTYHDHDTTSTRRNEDEKPATNSDWTASRLARIIQGMRNRSRKPTDVNVLGKSIVDQATGAIPKILPPEKDPIAVELGRRGGLKGGKARAAKMTKKARIASAKAAAAARWKKKKKA